MDQNNYKVQDQVEQESHIYHLHVGGLGQVIANIDEHSREDEHGRKIYRNHGLKRKKCFV